MKPKKLMQILEEEGWFIARSDGSHFIFKHPEKPGMPVVPVHNKDMKPGTLHQIIKIAGLKLK